MSRSEESAFQRTIANDPYDHVARLVYADWLDENNQPKEANRQRSVAYGLEHYGEEIKQIHSDQTVPYASPDINLELNDGYYPVGGTIYGTDGVPYVIPDHRDNGIEPIIKHMELNPEVESYTDGDLFYSSDMPKDIRNNFHKSMGEKSEKLHHYGDYDTFFADPSPQSVIESLAEAHDDRDKVDY